MILAIKALNPHGIYPANSRRISGRRFSPSEKWKATQNQGVPILGDPGSVSRARRKCATKVLIQAWAEKPPGTDSHLTISKRSSECWLLIGHKKCFVLLCSIGEQHFLNSFREFVHDGYYLATFARFVHQAFLIRNEGTIYTDESKNVWMLPAGAIQFAVRKFCF